MKNGQYKLAIAPNNYPGKKYRGRYCSEHTLVYWQHYGVIPDANQVIHHKDGNKYNNAIENLELLDKSIHVKNHKGSNGRAYLKLRCPGCGKVFIRDKSHSYFYSKNDGVTCCSRKCVGIYTALPNEEKKQRKQNMLIEEFQVYNNKTQ